VETITEDAEMELCDVLIEMDELVRIPEERLDVPLDCEVDEPMERLDEVGGEEDTKERIDELEMAEGVDDDAGWNDDMVLDCDVEEATDVTMRSGQIKISYHCPCTHSTHVILIWKS
jgi:hypothetical protein